MELIGIRERGPGRRPLGRQRRYIGKPCPYCGVTMTRRSGHLANTAPSRDHLIPFSRGGLNVTENIIVCCRGCNEDKGKLTAEEYAAVRAGLASRLDPWYDRLVAKGVLERSAVMVLPAGFEPANVGV
jgi:5-methylcytosine-specific restriction endonuclease McrA